ncbi:cation:proton antiporter [Saccharomonospora glauca]|jgi:Kef-type K+ transport system membrane component KefB|uniref:Kef-type K+ transport system, membrane component n=1 Tax=Saccharomonospora glauca K62 TaxID=928724 RepID=I1D1Z2_9PSEU|nr:cation:proton antiporter [Saccharomonospora glauca]EIE98966.1 Kef-type K+ transport system, membrane component [Saccharomonospora glauca K62]
MTVISRNRRTWLGLGAGLLVLVLGVVVWAGGTVRSEAGGGVDPLARFLLAVAVILVVSHVLGSVLRRVGQPRVVGEMLGGVMLGPSVLGSMWPEAMQWLFTADALGHLDKVGQLGLVVFMFLLGCELRLDRIDRPATVAATVAGGTGLPFAVGIGLACAFAGLLSPRGFTVPYALFLGLALSITALPVLARILLDLKLEETGVGVLTVSAAAIGDGVAWLVLTVILTATGQGTHASAAETAYLAAALVVVTFLCVRPALAVLVRKVRSKQLLTVVLLAGAITFSAVTQAINLHPVIGAFLFGAVVPRDSEPVRRVGHQLQGFTLIVLLPVFFAGVGLNTSVGLLGGDLVAWTVFGTLLVASVTAKFVGAGGAARLTGLPTRQAVWVGAAMNCRGVTELVIAAIGFQAGLINQLGFTMLVLLAVITTVLSNWALRWLSPDGVALDRSRAPMGSTGKDAR